MARNRQVSPAYLVRSYRGGGGMVLFFLHRITGLAVLGFLALHILDTFLVVLGPGPYNAVMRVYHHPLFRVAEWVLVACVLFHALNGLRVVLLDLSEWCVRNDWALRPAVALLFVLGMAPTSVLMLGPLLRR